MIVSLTQAAAREPATAGTKAATLATLAHEGFPVPDGFVVTGDSEPTMETIGRLGGDRFAVRSSAVAEDLPDASFAGLYESYLNVPPEQVADAVRRCRASAGSERVIAYRPAGGEMAVLVQRMVDAEAAGVALTANPVTGDPGEIVITAVRGLGESLVSGEAVGEEWIARSGRLTPTRPAAVLQRHQAAAVAELARRVRDRFGGPQDLEWAIENGRLSLLQARPMTALPEPVSWQPPGPGLWLRNFRLGEWLPDPVTPLFADWLLGRLDEGFRQGMRETAGAVVPFAHAVVNGWYYTRPVPSLRYLPGAIRRSRGRLLPFMLNALIRPERDPAGADRALLDRLYWRWRDEVLPAYRLLLTRQPRDPVRLIDDIGHMAGRHLWYLAIVGGAAWKMEACLATFIEHHHLDHDAQVLLSGLPGTSRSVPAHAVHSIDWYHPTAGETRPHPAPSTHGPQLPGAVASAPAAARVRAEHACRKALADRPESLSRFSDMLATAQRYAAIREEQARELTLGWPLMRDCLRRMGQALPEPDDVYFLTRRELDRPADAIDRIRERRSAWERQRRLIAPLTIGAPPPLIGRRLQRSLGLIRAARTDSALTGQGASAGRATGPVRVVRGPDDFAKVAPGDVLVARATAPAWTPLFATVAAVVTDGGTLAAHASLIAREYGIPAVVATGDATVRLHDGQIVTVDGSRGLVEL
ncbi:PEP/pyruvate-binding domain-containing protein [Nonomuraea sp. NPDC048916]|uniref:PEP/pyruvate-binding domain-containing protein n=1 Tax=Nonomuraea sp. NPDC048916 TaxID=3154232 RepID=UPI00340E6947